MPCRGSCSKRIAAAGVLLAVVVHPSLARSQALPSAEEVIARHVEAIGGREAIESRTSLHFTGAVEIVGQGLVGEMEVYSAAPNKMLNSVSFADVGVETRSGYDGEVGWSVDTMMGERLLQGGELQQLIDESDFYADLHNPDRFETMETVDLVQFDGRPAHKVRLVHRSGREVFEYFDLESGRMSGVEGEQETLMGTLNVVTYLREYQDFDGIMLPVSMLQEMGPGQSIQVTVRTVEYNSVDPAVFELPAAIKTLLR